MDTTKKLIENNTEYYQKLDNLQNEFNTMKEQMKQEIEQVVDTYNKDNFTFKIREKTVVSDEELSDLNEEQSKAQML